MSNDRSERVARLRAYYRSQLLCMPLGRLRMLAFDVGIPSNELARETLAEVLADHRAESMITRLDAIDAKEQGT